MTKSWQESVLSKLNGPLKEFGQANVEAVRNTLHSGDPNNPNETGGGACVVINIAAAHVPDFCNEGYKNIYELSVGSKPPRPSKTREFVDGALSAGLGINPEETYFAALELTGAGIRFYGDFCLVLRQDFVGRDLPLLDRNSYDLVRSPIKQEVGRNPVKCAGKVTELGGHYVPDLEPIAVGKVMSQTMLGERRLTAGDIAEKLRAVEDYIELLLQKKVCASHISEARSSASDAAAEALTSTHLSAGLPPSIAQLTSLSQRRSAEKALRKARIPLRVVTTSGRIKG